MWCYSASTKRELWFCVDQDRRGELNIRGIGDFEEAIFHNRYQKMKTSFFIIALTGIDKYAYNHKDNPLVVPIGCLKD